MRILLAALALWVVPGAARADAISPFEGECPPGLDRGIAGHAEVCAPRACELDAQCGDGAACREIHECWAEREVSNERVEGTHRAQIVVGACQGGRCAEADARCHTRRQCEPTGATPAWDATGRRWTGEPHVAHACGCGVGGRPAAPLGLLGAALAIAALRRLRSFARARVIVG